MVVVITGATAGVGRATALAFARRGAKLGLIARDEAALDDTRAVENGGEKVGHGSGGLTSLRAAQ